MNAGRRRRGIDDVCTHAGTVITHGPATVGADARSVHTANARAQCIRRHRRVGSTRGHHDAGTDATTARRTPAQRPPRRCQRHLGCRRLISAFGGAGLRGGELVAVREVIDDPLQGDRKTTRVCRPAAIYKFVTERCLENGLDVRYRETCFARAKCPFGDAGGGRTREPSANSIPNQSRHGPALGGAFVYSGWITTTSHVFRCSEWSVAPKNLRGRPNWTQIARGNPSSLRFILRTRSARPAAVDTTSPTICLSEVL